jgi:hypothetical protein
MAAINDEAKVGLTRSFWIQLDWRRKAQRPAIAALKGADGRLASDPAGQARVLAAHYSKLAQPDSCAEFDEAWRVHVSGEVQRLGPQPAPQPNALNVPIGSGEIARAIKKLKTNKAGTDDGMINEFFKHGGGAMLHLLVCLFNAVFKTEKVPAQWRQGTIVNLFKTGDPTDPGNYRGITLLSCLGKLFSKVLNERLIQHLEDCSSLHESQNGFRPARNCVEHIFSLSQVVQGRIREKKLTFACFFDVRKAFDSVWLAGLFCKCSQKGIRGRILRVLQDMYRKSESCVLVGGHKSARFKVAQGVAQGCPLSTTLFAIFVDDLLHELHARGVGIPVQESVVRVHVCRRLSGCCRVPAKFAAVHYCGGVVAQQMAAEG